ncbi:recombinase family protein [Streptomyces sp. NPDC056373]|uniref:recombinase family protein n=1 Tax=Streptomyces sp. NPDC056373 TaxID=3345798 RepID=UPI0035DA317B
MTQAPDTFRSTTALDGDPYIGYVRVSTWREEKISPDIQKASILEWARRHGRRIVAWVVDLDATGRNFQRKIMGAIERVEKREAKGIAVWRYSRFGRDRVGNAINLARLEAIGGRLESATEPVDATTAIGRFQRGMILEFGAFESDRTGEQWKEVHEHRLAAQLPSGGRPRFGYTWFPRRVPDANAPGGFRLQEERYEIDPKVAPHVASCYAQYIAGTGAKRLVQQLNAAGLRTMRGGLWRQDSLLRYLDSGFAAGYLRVRDECDCPKVGDGKSYKSCGHWRYFLGAQLPIIGYDPDIDYANLDDTGREQIIRRAGELWQEYRTRRASVARTPIRARAVAHALTSLVRCQLCRGSSSGHGNEKDVIWRCALHDQSDGCEGTSGTGSELERIVLEKLQEVADDIDALPATEEDAPALEPTVEQELAQLRLEHEQAQDALSRLIMDYARNPQRYPADAYDKACATLTDDRDKVAARIAELGGEGELEAEEDEQPTREEVRPLIVGMLPEWKTFTNIQRNLILKQIIRCVRVYPRPSRYETRADVLFVWDPPDDGRWGSDARM